MASSADNLVRDAIKAYHAGSVDEARILLLQAVEVDEASEQAWLWLSAVVDTDHDRQTCLENVLTINPDNEKAKQGLKILKDKAQTGPATRRQQLAAEDDDPFAHVSFTGSSSPAPKPISPFATEDDDELPTDVSWGTLETSSASARPTAPEPSSAEYEDWISNLNIGGNDAVEIFGDAPDNAASSEEPGFTAAPFIGSEEIFDGETAFELDDNLFGLDDEAFESLTDSSLGGSPFSADIDSDFPETDSTPARPPASRPAAPLSPVPKSPPRPEPVPGKAGAESKPLGFGLIDDEGFGFDFEDTNIESLDPEEYFAYIPAEIKATRLPGTNERYPPLMILGLLLLFGLNIGALVLVLNSLNAA